MKVHSDIIIFEILNLYFEITEENEINIKKLENSFYALINIINEKNASNIKLDFNIEIEKFLDNFSNNIQEQCGNIYLTSELKELFNAIIDSHNNLTTTDYDCQSYVYDKRIYNTLNIKLPIEEMNEYFELNRLIIKSFLHLGKNEYYNYFDSLAIERLKELIETLKEKLNEADNSTLAKLKMCYNYFNDLLLPNTDEKHINSAWNTILFSNNPQRLYSLTYDRIEYLVEMIDEESDEESEEILNNAFNEDTDEENTKLSEISYFLTIFLIELNSFLKNNPYTIAKEALLIKKYLLLNIPELIHIEKYYLKHYTIDNLPEPNIPEDLTPASFENLKKKVVECTTYLVKTNNELTKPHVLAKAISAALFIKVFINISINQDSIIDIIDLIENSLFYKKPGYETISTLVDNLIFGNSPTIQR